ncbi:MAG TPA: type I DNA topoisomerase [Ignavibacteria bacterium]
MSKYLVIVESPSKAKTIKKYLGTDYIVEASVGHIKNLPKSKLSVDFEKNFEPTFEIIEGKHKILKVIQSAAKGSEKVFIATDPDREGEAIGADVADEIVKINPNIFRVLFNEITKSGVENAMKHPRKIDYHLVESQTARRVMDRLLGYKLSPFLWKVFYYGLSAGRVQSVALKLICERELEIEQFTPKEYWSIHGTFIKTSANSKSFNAKLFKINGENLKFNGEEPRVRNIDEAYKILEELKNCKFRISDIIVKEVRRTAPVPFITSSLQQSASSKLGFAPKRTMSLAQKLYEGIEIHKGEGNIGLITYMRTDSTRISLDAQKAAADYIEKNYGKEYLVDNSIKKSTKKKANVQDAHEAIRPTDVNIKPEDLKKLDKDLIALYTLIRNRFLASQMSPAIMTQKTIIIDSISMGTSQHKYFFRATGSEIKFAGYLKLFEDLSEDIVKDEEEDNPSLPLDLAINDILKSISMIKEQHFTNPPPRYTESSLIKQLDALGIGRPSTFALIVSTVVDRKYVDLKEKRLFATDLGMAVNGVLAKYFFDVIDYQFTAKMEEELDTIANNKATYSDVLHDFYHPFYKDLLTAEKIVKDIKLQLIEKTDIDCPECGKETGAKMIKKWSRNGLFLSCESYPKCSAAMPLIKDDANEIITDHSTNMVCEKCGAGMILRVGKFGKFYGCSNYPKCNGVKPFTLGIKCPKCAEGEIIERKGGRMRRVFYGCSKYPNCDFISNYEPVIQECESCKNGYLVKKVTNKDGNFLECPVCKAKIKEDSEVQTLN